MPFPVFPFALICYILGIVSRMMLSKPTISWEWIGSILAGLPLLVFPSMPAVFAVLSIGEVSKTWYGPATTLFTLGFFVPEELNKYFRRALKRGE